MFQICLSSSYRFQLSLWLIIIHLSAMGQDSQGKDRECVNLSDDPGAVPYLLHGTKYW